MLQSIRDRLTGILAFFILGILVIPFAFVGVNSYFTSGTENIVARINDKEITFNDFNQSYSNFRRRMQQIMGAAFDPLEYDTLVARREHLDRLIDEELINQAAGTMGLAVDDERLGDQIRSIPAFQVDGVFNAEVYQARLRAQGLTPKQFEQEMRLQSVFAQLPTALTSSSFSTRDELNRYVALLDEKREFQTVIFNRDLNSIPAEVASEEILEFYEANPDRFQSEEQVVIDYLELDAVEVATGTEPDEDFLRARFEQQEGRFITPEQRRASHILIEVTPDAAEAEKETARQTAEDLSRRIKGGEDFAALAAEYSDDLGSRDSGGDLGWIEPGLMTELFEQALYELTVAEPVSGPVQTGFGWHVIRLDEVIAASGMAFEEARQVLIDEHLKEEAEREYLEIADRLVDLIYEDPTTLEHAASALGLEIKTTGPFGRIGGEGIAANPEVVAAAFSDMVMEQESVSDPIDVEENHMVMLHLREYLPAVTRPLEEVSDEIMSELLTQRADEAARKSAESVMSALENGTKNFAELSEEAELQLVTVNAAGRRDIDPDPVLIGGIFMLEKPDPDSVTRAVLGTSNGSAVVELISVTAGELAEDAFLARQQYERQIANAMASAEAMGLLAQLRDSAIIQVYEEQLQ